jgi:hypothetical protein
MLQLFSASDAEPHLLAFVRSWCAHLASDDWTAALAMIDEPNGYGITWDRERILRLVHDAFHAGTGFARDFGAPYFSDPATATGDERCHFGDTEEGGFWFDYDVPLNGIFSDLTAQFEAHPRADGLAIVLHDLHVM